MCEESFNLDSGWVREREKEVLEPLSESTKAERESVVVAVVVVAAGEEGERLCTRQISRQMRGANVFKISQNEEKNT